jgi:prepilin-type N-terminal cleavage/methylation domain-containing protein
MSRRAGFTLVELVIALVVTGLVVSLAYGAAQAGFDTDERLARAREGAESEAVARSIIADAIRHALPGIRGGTRVFELTRAPTADGGTSSALRFLTRGVVPPFGTSGAWVVGLEPTAGGLAVRARPASSGEPGDASIDALLPNVRSIDVRVLSRDSREGWLTSWNDVERSPVAVAITLRDADGRSRGAPLVARIGLEGNP